LKLLECGKKIELFPNTYMRIIETCKNILTNPQDIKYLEEDGLIDIYDCIESYELTGEEYKAAQELNKFILGNPALLKISHYCTESIVRCTLKVYNDHLKSPEYKPELTFCLSIYKNILLSKDLTEEEKESANSVKDVIENSIKDEKISAILEKIEGLKRAKKYRDIIDTCKNIIKMDPNMEQLERVLVEMKLPVSIDSNDKKIVLDKNIVVSKEDFEFFEKYLSEEQKEEITLWVWQYIFAVQQIESLIESKINSLQLIQSNLNSIFEKDIQKAISNCPWEYKGAMDRSINSLIFESRFKDLITDIDLNDDEPL